MSARCDFHEQPRGDCVHCLGYELAWLRAENVRLTEWIRHLVENDPELPDLYTLLKAAGWERRGAVGTHATWIEP